MKRCFKKAVAFGLALSMFASCMVVSAEENEGNGIAVIEDAVYDEAVSFMDTVVLLENGHWAKRIEDEVTGERVPYTDVTAETNIVFIDGEGNKKVISNKDANGEMIFDAVLPEITNLDSNDYICVFKGEDRAYISPEGEFFGEELKFYKDVRYISDDYLLVSSDRESYDLINKSGNIVYSLNDKFGITLVGDFFYVNNGEKVSVLNKTDLTVVKEYTSSGDTRYINEKYIQINTIDGKIVLNNKGEEVLKGYSIDYCYSSKFSNDYLLVENKSEEGNEQYILVNMETEETVSIFKSYPEYFEDGYLLDRTGKVFVSTDGFIKMDLNEFEDRIRADLGDPSYNASIYYKSGILYVNVSTGVGDDDAVTYILKEKDGYDVSKMKKLNGYLKYSSKEKGLYILTNKMSRICGLYNLDDELIKDFNDVRYYTLGDDIPEMENVLTTIYTKDDNDIEALILDNGDIVGEYEAFKISGSYYMCGTKDGKLEVLNGSGKIVYSGVGEYKVGTGWFAEMRALDCVYSFANRNSFAVIKDEVCNVYDANGNKLELGDTYSGIGPCETISGSYRVGEEGSYGYYCYRNDDFDNGLCVTRKTDADGNYKYGVIKFNVVLEKGDCNGDKAINAQDALAVLKHAAKISILPDESVGEVTGDGLVNAQDALKILKLAAHIIEGFEK